MPDYVSLTAIFICGVCAKDVTAPVSIGDDHKVCPAYNCNPPIKKVYLQRDMELTDSCHGQTYVCKECLDDLNKLIKDYSEGKKK